tara:strand:+ start:6652 stop:7461 length:810 start_codon:yes stop_codon:yes gene_type:complete
MAITTRNQGLKTLLELTQRKQNVGGKSQEQVTACVLRSDGSELTTTSLVRDGKTSIGRFSTTSSGVDTICVPDINRLLGVLSAHGTKVTLEAEGSRIRVKSGKKTTTLTGDLGGLAFPHSSETIGEWEAKSVDLSKRLEPETGAYIMRDGSKRLPMATFKVESVELFEALRCDNINGQKLNRYRFKYDSGVLSVDVGDDIKGRTLTTLEFDGSGIDFEWDFEGGLEGLLKPFSGETTLYFIDFRPEGQGIRLFLLLPGGSWVFQAGVLE